MNAYLSPEKYIELFWRIATLFVAACLLLLYVSSSQAADVTLSWDPNGEQDLAGYTVYCSEGAPGAPYDHIGTYHLGNIDPDNPKCVITELQDDLAYYFVVTAYDAEGNESTFSNEICVLNGKNCPDMALIKQFVTRFYQQCLSRDPEAAGLEGWSNALFYHDLTGGDVAKGFIFSQEFLNSNTTNEEFLTILYQAFFDRNPDQAGFDGWLAAMNGGTDRDAILDGFLYSAEFYNLCGGFRIIPN